MTDKYSSELDSMRVQIHFKENSIPSVHAGPLTDESKAQLLALLQRVEVDSRLDEVNRALGWFTDNSGYLFYLDDRIKELKGSYYDPAQYLTSDIDEIVDSLYAHGQAGEFNKLAKKSATKSIQNLLAEAYQRGLRDGGLNNGT